MTPSSAKQKGRILQQHVRDKILYFNPELSSDDVRSTSMGAGGEDVQLSSAARTIFPYQIECKNKAKYAVYTDYSQASSHGNCEPLLIIKQNHKKPLAIVDAEHFFFLVRTMHELLTEQRYREQGHRHEV
jgi:hypothetical protein